MTFEWDDRKEHINISKHGIDFRQRHSCSVMIIVLKNMMIYIL